MTKFLSGDELRQWAKKCLSDAQTADDGFEKLRLTKMHEALTEMAQTQDWLDGRAAPVVLKSNCPDAQPTT